MFNLCFSSLYVNFVVFILSIFLFPVAKSPLIPQISSIILFFSLAFTSATINSFIFNTPLHTSFNTVLFNPFQFSLLPSPRVAPPTSIQGPPLLGASMYQGIKTQLVQARFSCDPFVVSLFRMHRRIAPLSSEYIDSA